MLVRYLPHWQWEAKLHRMNCQTLEGLTKLNTAEWWKGPRGVFTVPVEEDGSCEFWAIQRLCGWYQEDTDDLE